MKRLLKIIVAFILAYSWSWTDILKSHNWLNDSQRTWILATLGIVFLLQQAALTRVKPASRGEVNERRAVIDTYLESLLADYLSLLNQSNPPTLPQVRVNLMLPTRSWLFRWRLVMAYHQVLDGGTQYPNDELELAFKKGEGACGRAWKTRNIVGFDRTRDGPNASIVHKKKQKPLLNVQSVLSVPVLRKERVVGVLSMDSNAPISTTRFDSKGVAKLAQSYANDLGPFCFFDGVQG
jgi:hypothetical protein